MMMPLMDGSKLIATLRRDAPRVRIIASSGLGPADPASETKADAFLQKPYGADTLLPAIRRVLDGR
jgi:CheY-like chemotaxis protein